MSAAWLEAENLLRNGEFTRAGPAGPTTRGDGGDVVLPSAASDWHLFCNSPGPIETALLTGPGPSGLGNLLRVASAGPQNGLVQTFAPFNQGPTTVITLAWVYVVQGRVVIGSGNGGNTDGDAASYKTGVWERLAGLNRSAPANQTVIFAVEPETVFYLASVMAVDTAARLLPESPSAEPTVQGPARLRQLHADIERATAEIRHLGQQLAQLAARKAAVRAQIEEAQQQLSQQSSELNLLDTRQEVATPTFGSALGKTVGALLTELAAAEDAELIYTLQSFDLELFTHLQTSTDGDLRLRLPGFNEQIQPAGLSRLRVRLGPLPRTDAEAIERQAG